MCNILKLCMFTAANLISFYSIFFNYLLFSSDALSWQKIEIRTGKVD